MHSRRVRLRRALTTLIVLGFSHAALAQTSWTAFGARNAADLAVGANGVVWMIGTDNNVYRWDGSAFQQMPGGAWRIAVDPNGRAWVVNHGNEIYRWNGSSFELMPGKAIDIGIGANGDVWVLDVNGGPFKWDGSNWRPIGGGATRIAVDPAGNVWVVNATNHVWRWNRTNWDLLPGSGKDIAVGPDGMVYLVSTTAAPGGFQIQRWAAGQWIAADAAGSGVAAGPSGALYVIRDTGAVFSRAGGAAAPAPGAPPAVAGTAPAEDSQDFCWKKSFGRGVGTVPTQCSSGYDKDAGLCYSTCKAGYKGLGPVCWATCPSGFRDDGAYCFKPDSYGRGAGYPWQFGDALNDDGMRGRCERDHGAGNCEKDGAIYYPKCRANFHKVGCCVCSPDCPPNTTDIGVSCQKASHTRGVGVVPGCGSGLSYDAGLCYEGCPRDFDGVGPICWGKCPSDYPFACGAGCAVNEAACAAAVTEMTVETVSAAASMLSFFVGGPGAVAAAKTGVQVATRTAVKGGFKATLTGVKTAVKTNAKAFARAAMKTYLKKQFTDPRNLASNIWSVAGIAGKKGTSLAAANASAREMGTLKTEGQFDYSLLLSLDPTGFASMIYSFAKYGSCSVEDLAANVSVVDFGPGPVTANDVRTIELTVQNPTTITEITSSPFQGCSIVPNSDCAGKTLQPGQKCNVNVKVAGSGKIIGEVHVFTTAYDTIPFAIGVKANSAATSDCAFLPDADDAVNLSSLAGVWAWKDDQSQKFVIRNDGSVTSPLGSGTIRVIDPVARTFAFAAGAQPAVITLNAEHDRFSFVSGPNGGTSAVRRPWDSRCKPGEQFYAGLCYDVPVGYEITVPGFIGKPCPSGWRDDGVSCYPIWTGVKVPYQADPNGSEAMQRPILVTDCANYSQVKGQKCPPNFKGPTACTCEAQPTSKEVKSLIGKIPGT